MNRTVAVGEEDFIKLRQEDSYYVDKTEILYELFHETNNAVTLFTRPRRFGKTLLMSMIGSFFDSSLDEKTAIDSFEGLSVMKHIEFCKEHMRKHPVIFISLKDVEGLSFESAFSMLKNVISDLCIRLDFLGKSEKPDIADRNKFNAIKRGSAGVEDIKNSLKVIMRMLYAETGKRVILLIDEYDVPLAKAEAHGYYIQMLDLIRGIMSMSLKTNEYLERAVITGCLRIPKESIFTGVNNFASYSVLDDEFSSYFGFTADEVDGILDSFGLGEKRNVIRQWYDGYHFGNSEVYCPWDVINYVADLKKNRNAMPDDYWEHTSGHDAIKGFLNGNDPTISDSFETLLNGGLISTNVTDALSYDNAYESNQNIWSVLLMTGYVTPTGTVAERVKEKNGYRLSLRIPNQEVADIFKSAVVDYFDEHVDSGKIDSLMSAFWNGDEKSASEILSDLLWNTISYMDYSEDYYHAFLTGIFVGRSFNTSSNKESGEGHPDLIIKDKPNRRAIIIEAKISDSRDNMEYWCDQALNQIETRGYARNEDEFYGYRETFCYGIAFYKKEALVKK